MEFVNPKQRKESAKEYVKNQEAITKLRKELGKKKNV